MIKINDVKYSYENSETEALRGVSISIADGEFVAIVGHNGSGKSTLAKMLNALQLPSSGSVTVFGMDTADESKTLDIRKKEFLHWICPAWLPVRNTVANLRSG